MRRQVPALSPVTPGALWRALWAGADAVAALERLLADEYGASAAVFTASGTDALRLAIETAVASVGDPTRPVALPAFSCFDLVTAAAGAEVDLVFYDVDPGTLAPAMPSLVEALDARPAAVVVANLFAYPIDWAAVRSACDGAGAVLVEDAAQGLGASWAGRPAGALGDLSVLSFGRGKGWTGGAGGALLGRRPGLDVSARRPGVDGRGARATRLLVTTAAQGLLGRPSLYWIPASMPWLELGETHYAEPREPGTAPAFSAALAAELRQRSVREIAVRRACAERWRALVTDASGPAGVRVPEPLAGGDAGYLRFPIVCDEPSRAEGLASAGGRWGVVRSYPRALTELAAARGRTVLADREMPGAARLGRALVTLPCHGRVGESDVRGVARLLGATERGSPSVGASGQLEKA